MVLRETVAPASVDERCAKVAARRRAKKIKPPNLVLSA